MTKEKIAKRIPSTRGEPIYVTVDGHAVEAYAGETVATILLANGNIIFQQDENAHAPRCLFCGMGVCFNCLVTIDGLPNIRACATLITAGMVIETRGCDHE